ncbi:33015_t:CDS:2, partial [Racocetra persica]
TILKKNITTNQNNDQDEDQTEDQVEDQTKDQVEDKSENNKPHPCINAIIVQKFLNMELQLEYKHILTIIVNQDIYNDEDMEIDNIIYKKEICKSIEEEIEPIYLSDIDNNS